jgi:hypothetical protein
MCGRNRTPSRCADDRDGSVRIDDMAAGDYALDVWFTGENDPQNINGRISYKFTVPPMPSGRSNEVLGIGTITLLTEFFNLDDRGLEDNERAH